MLSQEKNKSTIVDARHDKTIKMETIGERIKRLREAAGLKPRALATYVGVTRQAVDKWESGATGNLKLANLLKLCELFKLTADELITGENKRRPALRQITPEYKKNETWPFTLPWKEFDGLNDDQKATIDELIMSITTRWKRETELKKTPE